MTLRVTVTVDEAAFLALGQEWNALLATSPSNNLFLTWEWIATWWKIYGTGSRLNVLTARTSDGRLVGVAPLKCTTQGVRGLWNIDVIEFIGYGGDVTPEYLDFIVAPGLEGEVMPAFLERLCAEPEPPVLDLRPFAAHSANLTALQENLAGQPGHLQCVPDSVCPQMRLPESQQAFLSDRSRNYRKKIKESERRVARDFSAHLRVSATHEELQADFSALTDLHSRRWSGASRAFRSPQYLEFHRRFATLTFDRGWMRLFSLDHGPSPLASLYCFAYNGRYYYYQSGRDPSYPKHHLGLVLMHKVIQEAIKENATVFDFLRGQEPYKYHWAESCARNSRLIYWPSLSMWAFSGANALLARVGSLTNRELIAAKLSRRVSRGSEGAHA